MKRFFILTGLLFSLQSFAGVSIIPAVGGSIASSKMENTLTGTTSTATGTFAPVGGLGLNFGLYKAWEFETGGYYYARKYTAESVLGSMTLEMTSVFIPGVFRFRLSNYFSFAIGGWVGLGMGNIKAEILGVTVETDYETAEAEKMNYGVLGGITLEAPMGKSTWIVLDIRYLQGLQNVSKATGTTVKTADLLGLFGFRFML